MEFVLDTDASFDAIGSVLSQKDQQNKERAIAYDLHTMSSFGKGYCITGEEFLAIYYFCQHFNLVWKALPAANGSQGHYLHDENKDMDKLFE